MDSTIGMISCFFLPIFSPIFLIFFVVNDFNNNTGAVVGALERLLSLASNTPEKKCT